MIILKKLLGYQSKKLKKISLILIIKLEYIHLYINIGILSVFTKYYKINLDLDKLNNI